jgi:hypothetical protein
MLLGEILKTHGIQRKKLAAAILQTGGKPCGPALISRLVNHGEWPRNTPVTEMWAQIKKFLTEQGVSSEELSQAYLALTGGAGPDTQQQNDGEDYMSKPTLTQAARRVTGLRDAQEPFEFDIAGAGDLYLTDEARYVRAHLRNTAMNGGFIAIIS